MKSNKIFFAVSALALLSGATLAQAGTYSLAPAGQGPIDEAPARTSTLSRAQMRMAVDQARENGELVAAGQGPIGNRPPSVSLVSRASVKNDTLEARSQGTLVPAGEGAIDAAVVAHRGQPGTPVAFAKRGGRVSSAN